MKFRLGTLAVSVTVPFCALIAALLVTDKTGFMLYSLAAIIFHESGHLIAMKFTHCLPREIKLGLGGLTIIGAAPRSAANSAIIMLSGPLTNIAAAVLIFTVLNPEIDSKAYAAAITQAVVGLFNLLPIKGLDGGTVFYYLLNLRFSESRARLALCIISLLFSAIIAFLGGCAVFRAGANPTLLILGVYLLILNIPKLNLGEPF